MSEKKGFTPEETAELKQHLGEIEKALGTKVADNVKNAVETALKADSRVSELEAFKVKAEKDAAANQKALDELIAKSQKVEVKGANNISSAFGEAMEAKKEALANYTKNRNAISFELKDVGNIGANSNITVSGRLAMFVSW